jgi:carbon-monoxide dehydrogenase large subunit
VNDLGIKGVGESGVIAPSAAIASAVEDALISHGLGADTIRITELPLTAPRIWKAAQRP